MCDKAVDTHSSTIEYVPDQFKTQGMCYKAFHRCFSVFDPILDYYRTREICT